MHEYGVTQSLVATAVEEAQKAGAKKITEIRLVIGDLSTFIDESIQMYFDIISKGTMAEGAKLVFNRIPAEFQCRSCGYKFNKPDSGFECPECGGLGFPTGVGKEFYIESLEAE